jgi:hypothetical protein
MNVLFDFIWPAYQNRVQAEIEWLEEERIKTEQRLRNIDHRISMLVRDKQANVKFVLEQKERP